MMIVLQYLKLMYRLRLL